MTDATAELVDMTWLRHMANRLRVLARAIGDSPFPEPLNDVWHLQLSTDADRLDRTADEVERMHAALYLLTSMDGATRQ